MSAVRLWREQAQARWNHLSPRERRGVALLAVLLGIVVFAAVAVLPALQTLRESDARRAHLAQQRAHMLALQAQAQALQTRTQLSRQEALRQLQSLTTAPQLQLSVQGEQVTVQLKAVPAAVLAQWLTQARQQAQALPVQAQLTRGEAKPLAPATGPVTTTGPNPAPALSAATAAAATQSPSAPAAGAIVWDGSLVMSLPAARANP